MSGSSKMGIGLAFILMTLAMGCGPRLLPLTRFADGTLEAAGERRGVFLRARYLNSPNLGVEGMVPVVWWEVVQIDIRNQEGDDGIAVGRDRFTLVDSQGRAHRPLSVERILAYESPVMGALLPHQKNAVRRAIWRGGRLDDGQFGVGYLFFPKLPPGRTANLMIFDPDDQQEKDEITLSFATP